MVSGILCELWACGPLNTYANLSGPKLGYSCEDTWIPWRRHCSDGCGKRSGFSTFFSSFLKNPNYFYYKLALWHSKYECIIYSWLRVFNKREYGLIHITPFYPLWDNKPKLFYNYCICFGKKNITCVSDIFDNQNLLVNYYHAIYWKLETPM